MAAFGRRRSYGCRRHSLAPPRGFDAYLAHSLGAESRFLCAKCTIPGSADSRGTAIPPPESALFHEYFANISRRLAKISRSRLLQKIGDPFKKRAGTIR